MRARRPGSYDADMASFEVGVDCSGDPGLTVQSARDETDINVIVERFGLTGELPVTARVPLPAVDVDEVLDYRQALEYVKAAQASFMSLPAEVRATFQNDAAAFVEFAERPENLGKLREWGLAPAAPVEPPKAPEGGTPPPS